MAFLEISNLSKSYRKHAVIDDLSFSVEPGEFLVVFGPSGSGKTVLLRLIAGMVLPDAGRVLLGGTDVTDEPPERRDLAMAFQNFALYPHLSAFDNIASPLRARGLSDAPLRERVESAGKLLRIDHVLSHLPRALSNGQKQRTALARSLVGEPSVLLLDDPLRNVDAKVRYEMRLELPRLLRARGATVVYVTQDYKEAMALGDRIAVLDGGRFRQLDTPRAIYERPADRRIARLFGDPPINLLDTRRTADGVARVAGTPMRLADWVPERVTLGLRPEDIAVSRAPFDGAVPVEIDAITPLNDRQVMLLRTEDGTELFASQPQSAEDSASGFAAPASGRERMRAWAGFDLARAHVFDPATGDRIEDQPQTTRIEEYA